MAIVTGASSGLGVAFAQALAEAGADVALGARRADRLQETQRAGARAPDAGRSPWPPTSPGPRTASSWSTAAMEQLGRVDILVNNAGIGTAVPATRETPEQFRQVIDVNLNGCYWMAQACGRVMQPGSSIINISSVLGLTTAGLPQAAYAASKAALIGLTRDLAAQWTGRKGIRVNALAPGFFDSEMTEQYPPGYLEAMGPRIPMGRKGDPRELAAAARLPGQPGGGLRDRPDPARRRRHDHHLSATPGLRCEVADDRASAADGGKVCRPCASCRPTPGSAASPMPDRASAHRQRRAHVTPRKGDHPTASDRRGPAHRPGAHRDRGGVGAAPPPRRFCGSRPDPTWSCASARTGCTRGPAG